jgi:hypothetical protein
MASGENLRWRVSYCYLMRARRFPQLPVSSQNHRYLRSICEKHSKIAYNKGSFKMTEVLPTMYFSIVR